MSTIKTKKVQVGTDSTASNNFTIYQPATPDGTLRIGVGNADSPTEIAQFTSSGLNASALTGTLPAIDGSSLTNLPAPDALSTASGSAPSYSARAWVNFNGSGTVAIRESGNVSSITDNGVGDYTVNFTTAMPDVNYSVASSSISTNDARGGAFVGVKATAVNPTDLDAQQYLLTSSVTIGCARGATASSNGVAEDSDSVSIIIFR